MTEHRNTDEVLLRVSASPGRRLLGISALVTLGALLIWLTVTQPITFLWQVFLVVLGIGAFWLADQMRRATTHQIELTETELRDSDGTVIARLDDILAVDRGAFAFKPSNGFLVRTRDAGPRSWRPGLWWRVGKRIGVGGMTAAHQTKPMSEIIAVKLAQREGL